MPVWDDFSVAFLSLLNVSNLKIVLKFSEVKRTWFVWICGFFCFTLPINNMCTQSGQSVVLFLLPFIILANFLVGNRSLLQQVQMVCWFLHGSQRHNPFLIINFTVYMLLKGSKIASPDLNKELRKPSAIKIVPQCIA